MKKIFTSIAAVLLTIMASAQFTSGRLVAVQTSGSVSKGGSAVTLLEYTTAGVAGTSVAIPATGLTPLQMAAGPGGTEGFLTRSTDGSFLMLGGYSTSTTGITDITATTSSTAPRVIFKVDPSGTPTQVGSSTTNYSANDIRGAVSDGTNYWAAGASVASVDGIDYYGPGNAVALGTGATPVKAYGMQIFNGQIYYSTQKAGPSNTSSHLGIFSMSSVSSTLPTSGTVNTTQIIDMGTVVPADFSFNSTTDVCYVAIPLNTSGGGIQKWTKTGGIWTAQYILGTGVTNIGAYGLVVDYSGTNPIIYATTFETNTTGNRIIKITDTGAGSTATTLATASANTWFHGIAFAPCTLPAFSSVTNSGPICVGDALTLTANATGSALTYAWTGTGTFSSTTISNPSVTSGANTGKYYVTITNGCGFKASDSTSVTVNSLPTPSIANAAICAGDPAATFDAGTYSSYVWSANGTGTSKTTTGTTAGNYTCQVTDANGCKASATGILTVNALPTPSIANAAICVGDPAATFDAGTYSSYVWSANGTGTSKTTTGTTAGNYTCQVTDANGCKASATGVLTVNAIPTPSIANAAICAGDPAATFDAGTYSSYVWSANGTGTSKTTTGTTAGNYTCQVTDANGCKASATGVLTVNALPSVSFSGLASMYLVNDASATLNGTPNGGIFSGIGISGNTFNPSTAGVGGPYKIKYVYVDQNTGCVNSDSATVTVNNITTGVVSLENGNVFQAYPIPATEELNLNISLNTSTDVRIEMYDVLGNVVMQQALKQLPSGNNLISINRNAYNLPAGTYWLRVNLISNSSTIKVIFN